MMSSERYVLVGRRLAIRYTGCLAAAILMLVAQIIVVGLVRAEVILTDVIAVMVFGPPLVFVAYAPVRRGYTAIVKSALTGDLQTKRVAVERGLALPAVAARAYVTTWVFAFLTAIGLSEALVGLNAREVYGHVLSFVGLLFVASFPLYAVVEHALRPVLHDLFNDLAGTPEAEGMQFSRFGIPMRVGLSLVELAIAAVFFLGSRTITASFGVDISYENELRSTLLEIPLLIALTAGVGWAIAASVRGSIDELSASIRSAAEGDLTTRTAVTTTDELGALMEGVDRMVVNQAALIRSAGEVSRELSVSAVSVADGSDHSTQGVSEIAQAMQDVVAGAQTQFEQITVARAAADELTTAIERTTAATTQAIEISDDARELADEGSRSARQARESMEHMRGAIDQATEAVDRLGGDTADIGEIVETIVLIADQTNLLALNAAIEAARAGELGRGFAVVAEEVRQLAGESNDAAVRIAELIEGIRGTVGNTVEVVNRGGHKVGEGVAVVDGANERFAEIAESLKRIGDEVGVVDSRTTEVAGATQAVTDAIDEILSVTESVAALAQETSANTEEASAAAQQITSSADALRAMALELEKQITAFKV